MGPLCAHGRAYDGPMRPSLAEKSAFADSLVDVGELTIGVRRFPPTGDGVAIAGRHYVLVHGIGTSRRYFQPLALELAATGTVLALDLAGYGSTPKPQGNPSIAEHAAAIGHFLEREGIADPVIVGHSMGCQIVTALSVQQPALTDRIVLIAPTIEAGKNTVFEQGRRLAYDFLWESLQVNTIVFTDYLIRCRPLYFFRQLHHLLTDRIEERLPQVSAKTLVIVARDDYVVPVEWASQVSRLVQNGRLLVTDGPHVVMFRRATEIAAQIVQHSRS